MISIPEIDCHELQTLLSMLTTSSKPIYVDVRPEVGAKVVDCFNVVKRRVAAAGGFCVYGWQIWKSEHIIEAEAHAVWRMPNNIIIDLTPKELPYTIPQILFVSDVGMNYEGRQIDNVRLNISGNVLANDLIKVCERLFEFENLGERANHYDLSLLLTEDQKQHLLALQRWRHNLRFLLANNCTINSLCYCKSELPFGACHRPMLYQWLSVPV